MTKLLKLHDALMEKRTIFLSGEIKEKQRRRVVEQLLKLSLSTKDPIVLLIDCIGGNIDDTFHICDVIKKLVRTPVHAYAIGDCCSSACMVIACCSKRFALPNAQFLLHTASMDEQDISASNKLNRDLINDVRKKHQTMVQFLTAHLKIEEGALQKILRRGDRKHDNHINAETAVAIGLIDEIVREPLDVLL